MKNFKIILMLIMGVFFFASCKSDNGEITKIPGINDFTENSPSVANALNSISVSVTANSYNDAVEYPLNFNKLSTTLALSISGLKSGDLSIQIYNDTKQMLYSADYKQNLSYTGPIVFDEKPTKIRIIFNTLSANFNCSLTGI